MTGLFPDRRFAGFGPSHFDPSSAATALHFVLARQPTALRNRLRQKCPRRPGVYGMVDPRGRLIYVGKAKCLRTRLLSYFRTGSRDPKAGRIIDHTRAIVWEHAPTEFAALLRELELIRRWKPSYNVQGVPGSRRAMYICLGRKPAPYLFATRQPPAEVNAVYGPLTGGRKVADAVRRLNDLFRLRDCEQAQKMHFADQGELFPMLRPPGCLRVEIGTCTGPCAGGVTRNGYGRQTRAARAFLDGRDYSAVRALERDMAAAATAKAYERAAVLRDKLEILQWLADRLAWLQSARAEYTFVYPLAGEDGHALWYLISRGRVRAVVAAPRDITTRRAARAAIQAVFGPQAPEPATLPIEQMDSILLVAGWFRKYGEEKGLRLAPKDALGLCAAGTALAVG
ncbi:MAG TPA: GIY-YIG nuclease family protein [Gemmataceae bacterium]|nr:GIY-YIG nuclease family protein [Gemmataceae bacterium]